jgi:hypothetical protein
MYAHIKTHTHTHTHKNNHQKYVKYYAPEQKLLWLDIKWLNHLSHDPKTPNEFLGSKT